MTADTAKTLVCTVLILNDNQHLPHLFLRQTLQGIVILMDEETEVHRGKVISEPGSKPRSLRLQVCILPFFQRLGRCINSETGGSETSEDWWGTWKTEDASLLVTQGQKLKNNNMSNKQSRRCYLAPRYQFATFTAPRLANTQILNPVS